MATRVLGPASGGVGHVYLHASASGRFETSDPFKLSTDNYFFPHSPLHRVTVTVPHSSALSLDVPPGARAVLIQTPFGTTENISITTNSAQRTWYIGPDGMFLSTFPPSVTTIHLQATSENVPDVTVAFL